MWDDRFPAYVSTRQRREKAAAYVKAQRQRGRRLEPVPPITTRQMAQTFWGKAWCAGLESQADLASRLPRGRSYARHGAVVHLALEPGRIVAEVLGSELYRVTVTIKPLAALRWAAIVERCHGHVDSLIDLLQGRLSAAVMQTLTHADTGILPESGDLGFACSCPDWASMCKHVAAVLYAVGARLDIDQALLFALRQVDHQELVQHAMRGAAGLDDAQNASALGGADLSALFDIDLADDAPPASARPTRKKVEKSAPRKKKAAGNKGSRTTKPVTKSPKGGVTAAKTSVQAARKRRKAPRP